jgi:hypothetical protein
MPFKPRMTRPQFALLLLLLFVALALAGCGGNY